MVRFASTYAAFFFILSMAFAVEKAWAQQAETVFTGALSVKDGATYSYKLQFHDSAGIINGYSVTDAGGPDETRAAITGTVNTSGKEISFSETKIIKTRSQTSRDSFCFIQARLKQKGNKILKGSFAGYMPGGKIKCGSGEIILYSKAEILATLLKTGIMVDAAALIKRDTVNTAANSSALPKITQVAPGKTIEVTTDAKSAQLEIWDDKHPDGDVITIKHNGISVIDSYKLTSARKKLYVQLSSKVETIMLIANNEGEEPPNTAMLKLQAGTEIHYINASTKIGEPVYIIIKPKRP